MSCHLLYISLGEETWPTKISDLAKECWAEARKADIAQCTDATILILRQFSMMILQYVKDGRNTSTMGNAIIRYILDVQRCSGWPQQHEVYSILLLAAELNMVHTVQHWPTLMPPIRSLPHALMYHAIEKPFTCWLQPWELHRTDSQLLGHLIAEGYDLNLELVDHLGKPTMA